MKLSNPIKTVVRFCKKIYKNPLYGHESDYNIIKSTIETLSVDLKEYESKFKSILPVLQDKFLQDIISKYHDEDNQLWERIQLLELKFPYKKSCVLVLHVDKNRDTENILHYEYKKISIAEVLEKHLSTDMSVCYRCEKDNNMIFIVN